MTHTCCRCGGQGGDQMFDGWMPCYHCFTSGTCNCPQHHWDQIKGQWIADHDESEVLR